MAGVDHRVGKGKQFHLDCQFRRHDASRKQFENLTANFNWVGRAKIYGFPLRKHKFLVPTHWRMMLKGVTDKRKDARNKDKPIDLLNLSLTVHGTGEDLAQADYGRVVDRGLQCDSIHQHRSRRTKVTPRGYEPRHGHAQSQVSSRVDKELDDFLVPTRKKKSGSNEKIKEIYSNKSLVSSAGDAQAFPFDVTSSGNLKVKSRQVVYETEKFSVLVANPTSTKINVYLDENNINEGKYHRWRHEITKQDFANSYAMDAILSQAGISGLGSLIGDGPKRNACKIPTEYEGKETHEILDPELSLGRLGYREHDSINWPQISLPEKKDLFSEMRRRIHNRQCADCKILIGSEEFPCHLLVLQCYCELFDGLSAIKKVELSSEMCTAHAFSIIYDWMITDNDAFKFLNRENVLDVFNSAKYLGIKDLVEQCWGFIDNSEVFNEDTAFLLYIDAKTKNLDEVRELMLPRIQDFFLMLVSSQDWLELQVFDIKCFLQSNYIKVNCEMEVFMAAVRWLNHDFDAREKYKLEVFSCVRFGNMTAWQLVDIKKNPENCEFRELVNDPNVITMIDDGLAFVTIKNWYGQENNDFRHWSSVLRLTKPTPRNWSGTDQLHFTYREFLIYLDQYRRNQLIEKSKPKLCKF